MCASRRPSQIKFPRSHGFRKTATINHPPAGNGRLCSHSRLLQVRTIAGQLRARRIRAQISAETCSLSSDPKSIAFRQLELFNVTWADAVRRVPIWRRSVEGGRLPPQFSSWEQFRSLMPITDRAAVGDAKGDYFVDDHESATQRSTGGTTSQPLHFPVWKSEMAIASTVAWTARSWFGISPADKMFLIWGHSHLLGKGFRGFLNASHRRLSDWLVGYYRHSAYDLSPDALTKACVRLIRFRPAVLLGYSVALDRFAEVNQHRGPELRSLRLKAVIATAESFPSARSRELLEYLFGCQVVMEYGTVESGVMAHQRVDRRYQVFWQRWLFESDPDPVNAQRGALLVTSLFPRAFPLIRYRVGDRISDDPNTDNFDQTFKEVYGRCNDSLVLASGIVVHSESFTHAVKPCQKVRAFQVVQFSRESITLEVSVRSELNVDDHTAIRSRLGKIHSDLASIPIVQVDKHRQSLAGKTPMIIPYRS